jgi:hypothetical protein
LSEQALDTSSLLSDSFVRRGVIREMHRTVPSEDYESAAEPALPRLLKACRACGEFFRKRHKSTWSGTKAQWIGWLA